MYINKYWGKYIGNTNDTLNLVAFLENHQKEELSLSDIFAFPYQVPDRSSATVRPTVPYPSSPMFNWGSVFVKGDSLTLQD